MLWIETRTDKDAIERSERLWKPVETYRTAGRWTAQSPGPEREAGKFWADAIGDVRDEPGQRLEMARRQLPLPAAFREMAIALRALVRKARKEGTDYEPLLRELHHFAAIQSWCLPYNEIAQEPGFNVIERTPYARLAALDLRWNVIGCDQLPLLTKTDRASMRELWGEPAVHSTANQLYGASWEEGCRAVARQREQDMAIFKRDIGPILRGNRSTAPEPPPTRPRSFWSFLFR